ncbi:DUF4279 domain-containing protein [Candidatus Binatus sp.]|uniref:DUF4279 domain-containing protein n=1 Tax=Candidatus Binatus sp. TaxID=2811406 RepID=UPI003C83C65E
MSEELEFCSCKLCVRGDDLDPQQVTILLGVEPTDAYRKGEHLRFPPKHKDAGKPSSLIVQSGMWRLEVDKEKKWEWDATAQLDYWCVFLMRHEAGIRELRARGYDVMIDCFIDEGPVVYVDVSVELMQRLGNLGVALKFGFYNGENLPPEKKS